MDKTDPQLALLLLRNTERNEALKSQAQRLFGRTTRSSLPTDRKSLHPKIVNNVSGELERIRAEQKQYFDQHSKPAEQLKVGDKVRLKTGHREWVGAKVVENTEFPRSVIVETDSGQKYRRNNNHLHKTKANIKSPIYDTPNIGMEADINIDDITEIPMPIDVSKTTSENESHQNTSSQDPNNIEIQSQAQQQQQPMIKTTRSGRTIKPVERFDASVFSKSKK